MKGDNALTHPDTAAGQRLGPRRDEASVRDFLRVGALRKAQANHTKEPVGPDVRRVIFSILKSEESILSCSATCWCYAPGSRTEEYLQHGLRVHAGPLRRGIGQAMSSSATRAGSPAADPSKTRENSDKHSISRSALEDSARPCTKALTLTDVPVIIVRRRRRWRRTSRKGSIQGGVAVPLAIPAGTFPMHYAT